MTYIRILSSVGVRRRSSGRFDYVKNVWRDPTTFRVPCTTSAWYIWWTDTCYCRFTSSVIVNLAKSTVMHGHDSHPIAVHTIRSFVHSFIHPLGLLIMDQSVHPAAYTHSHLSPSSPHTHPNYRLSVHSKQLFNPLISSLYVINSTLPHCRSW